MNARQLAAACGNLPRKAAAASCGNLPQLAAQGRRGNLRQLAVQVGADAVLRLDGNLRQLTATCRQVYFCNLTASCGKLPQDAATSIST